MTKPLIDLAPVADAALSEFYDTPTFRLRRGQVVKWGKASGGRGAHCDECARLQHETRGTSGPRMAPREKRTITHAEGSQSLLLCSRHATAWRERDEADAPGTGKARR